MYKVSGVKTAKKTEIICKFNPPWQLAMRYGPEQYRQIPVILKFLRTGDDGKNWGVPPWAK